jgi:hypothetical protein
MPSQSSNGLLTGVREITVAELKYNVVALSKAV